MKVPLSWLAGLARLPEPHELAERLTAAGLECEIEEPLAIPDGVVTGRILSCEKHPDADRLTVCSVDVGDGSPRAIVCGAPNAQAGPVGACALPGAHLGEFEIAERKLRGVLSQGMLCSETELGLSDDHSGILLLPEDTPVGVPLGEALGLEPCLVTEPTSNRGDLMSVRGIAREVRAITAEGSAPAEVPGPEGVDAGGWRIDIEDAGDCPRYGGRVIEGLVAGPSPGWMARRLKAAGVRPIMNLVDVTNYVLLEYGHPLHAFDLELLTGQTIGVRRARKGEKIVTLDDKERDLTPDVLMITDGSGVVATGGLMGGASTRVSEGTTRVFLEGASFSAARIRAGARALRLVTDASQRFERGVDPESVPAALDRAVELFLELCPDARLVHATDSYPAPIAPRRVGLRRRTLLRILGIEPPASEVRDIFGRLDLEVVEETEDAWQVVVPTFRRDLIAEEDLVEEIGRIWGYDRIPERTAGPAAIAPLREPRVEALENARRCLLGLGLTEIVTPSLVDSSREEENIPASEFFGKPVPLRNPMSRDRDSLRGSLLSSLLAVLATNTHRGTRDVALFEAGRTYHGTADSGIRERLRAGVLLAGLGRAAGSPMGAKSCDFFDMKGLVEVYVEGFWGGPARMTEGAPAPFAAGEAATVEVGGTSVGFLGAIDPSVRHRYDLPDELPVLVAELDLEAPAVAPLTGREFRELPKFPGANRDLAFVVGRSVRHDQVVDAVQRAAGELLAGLRLFDVWEGEPLAAGEKSLAFTLVFRSAKRSLTNDEVDERVEKIVTHVAKELGARIR
jgi:phenylalanyl-tRNA synthetase beta chain